MCLNGASLDPSTCECSVNCPTWGPLCERCPRNPAGMECSGRGHCNAGKCSCLKGFSGKSCEVKLDQYVCKISDYGDITAFNNKLESSISVLGEYTLLKKTLSTGDTISLHIEVGSSKTSDKNLQGVKAVVMKYISKTAQDAIESMSLFSPEKIGELVKYGEDCGSVQVFEEKQVKSSRGNMKLTRHGKNEFSITSKDGTEARIIVRGNDKFSYMDVTTTIMSSKFENVDGICGSPFQDPTQGYGGRQFLKSFVTNKAMSLLKCHDAISHRFVGLSSGLTKQSSGLRFREARRKTEFVGWENVNWGEVSVPPVAKPTTVNLLPVECRADPIEVEKQCKQFLGKDDISNMNRGDSRLSPYKACSKVMCKTKDLNEGLAAGRIEAKKNDDAFREKEEARLDNLLFSVENEAASKAKKAFDDFANSGNVCPELKN